MESMADRLRTAMQMREMSPTDLIARKVLSKAGVYFLLDGNTKAEKVRAETVDKLCKTLRVRREWLLTGKLPIEGDDAEKWADVLGYAQAAGLGEGIEALEYQETHSLKFRADSLRRKRLNRDDLGVVYGSGDSMLPRIRSGDVILFDKTDTRPRDEALFLVLVRGLAGDGYSIKRCRHFGDDVYFDALNPEGDHQWRKPRKKDDPRSPIEIIGRVRWIGSWEG